MEDYNGDLDDDEALQIALSLSLENSAVPAAPAERSANIAQSLSTPPSRRSRREEHQKDAEQSLPADHIDVATFAFAPVSTAVYDDDDDATAAAAAQAPSHTAWGQVVESLMSDYIKDVKAKQTDNYEHLKVLCPSTETEAPKKPRIDRKNLNSVQLDALLRARWSMFNRLIDLGALYAEQRAGIANLPRKLDGHHIAGAINLLDIPIRKEDTVLMMRVGKAQAEDPVNVDEMMLFVKQFEQLQLLAKAGEGDEPGTAEKVREPLPAFDVSKCPAQYYQEIDWPSWCVIFDRVHLRVEKNGVVW